MAEVQDDFSMSEEKILGHVFGIKCMNQVAKSSRIKKEDKKQLSSIAPHP